MVAIKNHHMAWEVAIKEMIMAITKAQTSTITMAICQGITKMIRNHCSLEESQAVMAMGELEAPTNKGKITY